MHAGGLGSVNVKGHRGAGVEAADSGVRWSSEKGSETDRDGFGEGNGCVRVGCGGRNARLYCTMYRIEQISD